MRCSTPICHFFPSCNGHRTLPLDGALVDALTELRKRQTAESAEAGPAYQAGLDGLDLYEGGEYVVTDELGLPVHPEWYSDEFGRLLKRLGQAKSAAGSRPQARNTD